MKVKVYYDSSYNGGNIYSIIGAVRAELKRQNRICDYELMRNRVFESVINENAISVINEYVDLIDTAKKEKRGQPFEPEISEMSETVEVTNANQS